MSRRARRLMDRDWRVLEGGQAEVAEELVADGGRYRTYQTTTSPIRDASGCLSGTVSVARDVTDQRNLTAERDALTEECDALTA